MLFMDFKDGFYILIKLKNMEVFIGTTSNLKAEHMVPMPLGSYFLQTPMIKDHSADGRMESGRMGWREPTDGEEGMGLN